MDPDTLTYDEWDALLIEEWFQADPGAPLPVSSREGEFEWAHQNQAAWRLVDESELNGLSKVEAQRLMLRTSHGERKFNPSQPRGPHTGKWIKGAGAAAGLVEWDELFSPGDRVYHKDQNKYGTFVGMFSSGPRAAVTFDGDAGPSVVKVTDLVSSTVKYRVPTPGKGWDVTVMGPVGESTRFFTKGGHSVAVRDTTVTHEQVQPILTLTDRLQTDNPVPDTGFVTVNIITREKMNRLWPPNRKKGTQTDGFAFRGTGQITLAGDTLTRGVEDSHGFNIPAGDSVTRGEYVLAHEWGHAIDARDPAMVKLDGTQHPSKNSKYGKTNEHERYAEGFAEFYLSDGKTALLSPREDAAKYGWTVTVPP